MKEFWEFANEVKIMHSTDPLQQGKKKKKD